VFNPVDVPDRKKWVVSSPNLEARAGDGVHELCWVENGKIDPEFFYRGFEEGVIFGCVEHESLGCASAEVSDIATGPRSHT